MSIAGTTISRWYGNRPAAFFLAFDDHCPTHVTVVIPELSRRRMAGTYYINPGNGNFDAALWTELAKKPHVILGHHTFNHRGCETLEQFEWQIARCWDALALLQPHRAVPGRLIAYAKPGGQTWGITDEQMMPVLARYHCIQRPKFNGPTITLKAIEDTLDYIDRTVADGAAGHLDFHGVAGDWLATPMDWFTALLDRIEQYRDRLWLTDWLSVHKYQTQRDAAEVGVLSADQREIRLRLTCGADPTLYDHPLTLQTRVPWARCWFGDQLLEARNGVIQFDLAPNAEARLLSSPIHS